MSARNEPITKTMPALAGAGIQHVVGAAELGVAMQVSASFALAAGTTDAITFAGLVTPAGNRIAPPTDLDYIVLVTGNSAAAVDLSSRSATGFNLVGGTLADVVAVVIIGRFAPMVR